MSELVNKYPDRFATAVASLLMNDIDAAILELDRAMNDLKMRGIQICSSINGKSLDPPSSSPYMKK
ncbi:MAG: hypothetical protein QGG48_06815, partial [Desulfatiglandales bacterium]|nr:hypothetical protein [Desulfatiglandales bacterium]